MSQRTVPALALAAASLAFLALGGCGSESTESFKFASSSIKPETSKGAGVGEAPPEAAQPGGGAAAVAKAPVEDRKIIYTANLDIIVKDLDEATRAVESHLAANRGRVVRSEARSDAGARRTRTFTLEVPVANFNTLVDRLKEIGTPERDAVDSQDVTEEYVDIKARLKNLREQEDKLNELLKEKRKEEKLEDVIKVSDRIYEVRQVIERVEGRMKYLESKAAFSTVNLTLREIKDYQPPTAPTFGNRVSHTFEVSWESFTAFLKNAALAAVAIVPWLPILLPLGLIGFLGIRRMARVSSVRHAPPHAPRAMTAHDAVADLQGLREEEQPPGNEHPSRPEG